MHAEATYLDSSAIVRLVVHEKESPALRRYLAQRDLLVCSALARAEVGRSLLPLGPEFTARGAEVLSRIDLVRVGARTLDLATALQPAELSAVEAIHLATVHQLGADVESLVTYDESMATAATALGWRVVAPA